VDKFCAALRRIAEFANGQRVDASAASGSPFDDGHTLTRPRELSRRHQARGASPDDQKFRQMSRGHDAVISGLIGS
jgi:hypothetical protein